MTWRSADALVDALLHEGYLLYPYRGSVVKNRYRWQFGVVGPRAQDGSVVGEPSVMQTECLLEPGANPRLEVKVRFLQVEARTVERLVRTPDAWESVESLIVDGRELVSWDEAVPRDLSVPDVSVGSPFSERYTFCVEGGREVEAIRNDAGEVVARVVRERWSLHCDIHLAVEAAGPLRKLRIRIVNTTACAEDDRGRVSALRRSLVATHTMLAVTDGAFVSLLDPPPHAVASAATCENVRTWPVLVGEAPQRNLTLSAPIILYDYPTIAPESPGDLFDGTEIDEILTLRVLTLTDGERQEALATDPRAGRLLERSAALSPEALGRLHGTVRRPGAAAKEGRELSAWETFLNPRGRDAEETLEIDGKRVAKGSRVRLRPSARDERRADAMDMFLLGQAATVAAVYRDLEDQAHIAVTVDSDGAADLHEWKGRYFYFRPDEIEVLDTGPEFLRDAVPRAAQVLVAGIGNMFLGDDGFGPAVIQRLASGSFPEGVRVEDFGIRGVHLAYDLLGGCYASSIIVDAVSRGGAPGTLYVLEPELTKAPITSPDAHTMSVESVLGFLQQIGGKPGRVLIVGCEIASVAPEMGLTDAVASAVDEAAALVMRLVADEVG